ncbi:hotdog fold thioesterase [Amycolatopsis sp. K13G38]|uniref:Hotdog fold thioesterase n=1 Tax=Amycolatopsis acididurans TaxID=2724524 RepID=A0ABX1J0Y7_9PSEU|nr:hotdog domain-containing protein [Amycolatopsis acididurans]NKQ51937.1 hotdog fold thioesterase [Amycolatopsis acididurans]
MSLLCAGDGELVRGASLECVPGVVERHFGLTACRTEGKLLQSVSHVGPWMDSAHGGQQAGAAGVQFDHVMGEALYAVAPAEHWALTTELTFDIVVAPGWETETLHVNGWVTDSGPRGGFAQAELVDQRGALLAVGTTRVQYVPARTPQEKVETGEANGDERPSAVNFAAHLGVRLGAENGDPRADLVEPGLWTNDYGVLHGGVWASIVELAAGEVLADTGLRTAHVHVSYLRSPGLGSPVSAIARPVHAGRSFGVVEVTGRDGSGRPCVTATVTGRRAD